MTGGITSGRARSGELPLETVSAPVSLAVVPNIASANGVIERMRSPPDEPGDKIPLGATAARASDRNRTGDIFRGACGIAPISLVAAPNLGSAAFVQRGKVGLKSPVALTVPDRSDVNGNSEVETPALGVKTAFASGRNRTGERACDAIVAASVPLVVAPNLDSLTIVATRRGVGLISRNAIDIGGAVGLKKPVLGVANRRGEISLPAGAVTAPDPVGTESNVETFAFGRRGDERTGNNLSWEEFTVVSFAVLGGDVLVMMAATIAEPSATTISRVALLTLRAAKGNTC